MNVNFAQQVARCAPCRPRYVIYLTGFQGDDEVAEEPP